MEELNAQKCLYYAPISRAEYSQSDTLYIFEWKVLAI